MNARDAVIEAFGQHSFDYMDEHSHLHCRCSAIYTKAEFLEQHVINCIANLLGLWQTKYTDRIIGYIEETK